MTVSPPKSLWSKFPSAYEINTWVWLSGLSQKYGRGIELSSVPAPEWDAIGAYGFDAVWLMGVWERSPAGIAIANRNKDLLESFYRALPDFRPEDNVGSPYCVRRYTVDEHLGGPQALALARHALATRGMNLILDFVPNHVAPDHPWATTHPEYFIRGNADDLAKDPSSFIERGGTIYARGRDPFFPAWLDVLQLNAFDNGLRQAALETVSGIADQCDGVRCDMAMLLLNSIFGRTWGTRAGSHPSSEYWTELISAIKRRHPGFLFIAEAYWDLEWELQQQGFDFCYDKRLYDRLEHENAESIRLHLCADLDYQSKLLRFIENHDEPRAAAIFGLAKEQAAAVTTFTLPGMRLFHEGQFEGRTVRVPVFLGRRPHEPVNREVFTFYAKLLQEINQPVFRTGQWTLCERSGWPDNPSFQNLLAWSWQLDGDRYLIVVNLSDSPAQGRIKTPWAAQGPWIFTDALSNLIYERDGDEMLTSGLYVELGAWKYHLFRCMRKNKS